MSNLNNLFPIFYLGNIEYYANMLRFESIVFEQHENLPKQTYRTRCEILGSNGKLKLLLPIAKNGSRQAIKNVKLSTTENWQKLHWKSFEAAYRSSPYFEYYEDEFSSFYNSQQSSLLELNIELHKKVMELLKIDIGFTFSESFTPYKEKDFRTFFNSKALTNNNTLIDNSYIQVFNDRMKFQPNLSIVDLLFNEGPNSLSYLQKISA